MFMFTGEKESGPSCNFKFSSTTEERKRCRTCLDEISGQDQKKKKDKLPKLKKRCQKCGNGLCPEHVEVQLCNDCATDIGN